MNSAIKISPENLLPWGDMEDWESGAAAAPTEHILTGTSASVAREATIIKFGTYSAALTRAGNDATLYYSLPSFADYPGRKMTFGCWVYATVASRARLSISDGGGSTESAYHSGGSAWEFLTVTRNIDAAASWVRVEMQVNTGNTTAYFDGGVLVEGVTAMVNLTSYLDVAKWTPSYSYRGTDFKSARRDGQRTPTTVLQSMGFKISGTVVGNTITAARTNWDALAAILNQYRRKPNRDQELRDLYLYDDRLIKVVLDDMGIDYKGAMKVIEADLRFTAPTPYHQATNKTRVAQSLASSPATVTVTNAGTAITRPVIKVTAGGSSLTSVTVNNLTSGQLFSYTGTVTTGNSLVVDCDELTVQNNGVDDWTNFTGDIQMVIYPGGNEFKITSTATGGTARLDFFNKWL